MKSMGGLNVQPRGSESLEREIENPTGADSNMNDGSVVAVKELKRLQTPGR
ncbi:hypothetical protein ACOME3_009098 [Neoechinorhynchus agilis]